MTMRRAGQVAVAVMATMAASQALDAARQPASVPAGARGYRLRGYRWDAVLGQRWAVFEDAAHPERPLMAELDPDGRAGALPGRAELPAVSPVVQTQTVLKVAELVVHSGDAVTLWKAEGNVRMQLAAIAEGNAVLGGRVQLRVTGAGIFGSSGWRVSGTVRGPGSVEME